MNTLFNKSFLKKGENEGKWSNITEDSGLLGKVAQMIADLFSKIATAKLWDIIVYGWALAFLAASFISTSTATLTGWIAIISAILATLCVAMFIFSISTGNKNNGSSSSFNTKFQEVSTSLTGWDTGSMVTKWLLMVSFLMIIWFLFYTSAQIGTFIWSIADWISVSFKPEEGSTLMQTFSNSLTFILDAWKTFLMFYGYLFFVWFVIWFWLKGIGKVESESATITNLSIAVFLFVIAYWISGSLISPSLTSLQGVKPDLNIESEIAL